MIYSSLPFPNRLTRRLALSTRRLPVLRAINDDNGPYDSIFAPDLVPCFFMSRVILWGAENGPASTYLLFLLPTTLL
jgi:hypothetical protein